jgi:hypothetical protein
VIEALVAEDGTTPREEVAAEVRRTRELGEKIKPAFWKKWEAKFGLSKVSVPVESTAEVVVAPRVTESILEGVSFLHSINPAKRRVDCIERHLQYADSLAKQDLAFLLKASKVGANDIVSPDQSDRVRWALLKFFGRRVSA